MEVGAYDRAIHSFCPTVVVLWQCSRNLRKLVIGLATCIHWPFCLCWNRPYSVTTMKGVVVFRLVNCPILLVLANFGLSTVTDAYTEEPQSASSTHVRRQCLPDCPTSQQVVPHPCRLNDWVIDDVDQPDSLYCSIAVWWSCWQSVGNGVQSVSLTQSADLSVYGCCTVGHAVVGISASWHILAPMQGRLAGGQGQPQTRLRKVSNVYKTVGNLFCSLQNNTIIVIHWLVHIYMHMCVKKNPPRFSAIFSERLRISKIK